MCVGWGVEDGCWGVAGGFGGGYIISKHKYAVKFRSVIRKL